MNDIRRALGQAAWRLNLLALLRHLAVAATAALVVLIGARLAQRLFSLEMAWNAWFIAAPAAALVGAVAWTLITRPRPPRVARTLDERADLRESISTALIVEGRDDPWSTLVMDTARERARGVNVAQAIPIEAPRYWPVPLCTAMALLIVWIAVPNMDLLGLLEKREIAANRQQEIIQAHAEAQQAEQRVREAMARAGLRPTDERGESDPRLPEASDRTPEEVRRESVRSLTNMVDQIREMQTGERAQQLENLQQQMRQLRQPGPGPLNEFTRELARGNFEEAQRQLEEMMRQLAAGEITPEQREQLEQQMRNLSQQMQENAQNQARLEQAMRNAGMTAEQARQLAQQMQQMSPQQMQQAIQQAAQQMQQQTGQQMSQQQQQQLQQMAQAMQQSAQQCQNMGQSMQQMAQAMQGQQGQQGEQGMGQEGMQAMQQMLDQMSQMQQMAGEMNNLDSAMNEAMAQLAAMGAGQCQGGGEGNKDKDRLAALWDQEASNWGEGETQGRTGTGPGGQAGQGDGGRGPSGGEDGNLQQHRSNVRNTGQGPVIASSLVDGIGIRGDSVAEFQAVAETAGNAAAEALETRQVPREYRRSVQAYFGRLAQEAARQSQQPPQEPAQDAPDANRGG
ncbi:MAG: hypothetical protein KDA05_04830 [Phycisphaerales bacterium]|nr:hypothetical protein [Phycisphaerales bacterium]MCB9840277.1 hypothetical protein [Phycisphaeraceae bacterium]